jgi:hypothetical protein
VCNTCGSERPIWVNDFASFRYLLVHRRLRSRRCSWFIIRSRCDRMRQPRSLTFEYYYTMASSFQNHNGGWTISPRRLDRHKQLLRGDTGMINERRKNHDGAFASRLFLYFYCLGTPREKMSTARYITFCWLVLGAFVIP